VFVPHFTPAPGGRCGICGHWDPVAAYPVVRCGGGRAAQARGHPDPAAERGVSRRHVPSDQIALDLDTRRAQQRCQHDDRSQRPCHPDPPIGTHPNPVEPADFPPGHNAGRALRRPDAEDVKTAWRSTRTLEGLRRFGQVCLPAGHCPVHAQSPPQRHAGNQCRAGGTFTPTLQRAWSSWPRSADPSLRGEVR
jgi:hypothetical protein